jgi:hypothetical protein
MAYLSESYAHAFVGGTSQKLAREILRVVRRLIGGRNIYYFYEKCPPHRSLLRSSSLGPSAEQTKETWRCFIAEIFCSTRAEQF